MIRALFLSTLLTSSIIFSGQSPESQLTPPAKRKFNYNGKVETTYNQAKDESMVFFKLIPIKALETPKGPYEVQFSDERLEFTSYFAYPGQKLTAPSWVTVAFLSATEDPQKYTDQKLAVKADGQWINLGTMKVLSRRSYTRRGQLPLVREARELPIPYPRFLLLASAKKIKVRLGSVEFDLEKEQLEAIRDLAAHTVP